MKRPIALFGAAPAVTLALILVGTSGCASSEAARHEQERDARQAVRDARPSHVQQAHYEDDGSDQMTVGGDEGTLDASDIEGALHDHVAEIRDCYHLGHRSAPRAGGRVLLRFFIDGKGEAYDVAIVESSIGNHAIERCIADIGLGVVFEQPAGHKPTTFDYPVEFRPARQLTADRQRKP
jgi:hypothetical protein